MKLARIATVTAAVCLAAATAAAPASATDNIKTFGEQERYLDPSGSLVGYTVTDFIPSSAPVPHNGELFEATLTVDAIGGWANPWPTRFGARAESGDFYPFIADAPDAMGGASVPPGEKASGKLYFDVVGPVPNSVVYNDGMRDILAWVPGEPVGGTRP